MGTRQKEKFFLVECCESQIDGAKLTLNDQVLRVLFHNLIIVGLYLHASAMLVKKEVEVFWEKSLIPILKLQSCAEKIEALHTEWRII